MANDIYTKTAQDDAILWGRALAWLRTNSGKSQAEAAETIGRTTQGWQQWELATRKSLLKADNQRLAAEALGFEWKDLNAVRIALANGESPSLNYLAQPTTTPRTALPMVGDVRTGEAGRATYATEATALSVNDLLGPDVRLIRVAGEDMSPLVDPGGVVAFYTNTPPRRDQPCVLALHDGRYLVRRYVRTTPALVITLRYDCRTLDTGETVWAEITEQWPLSAVLDTHAVAFASNAI